MSLRYWGTVAGLAVLTLSACGENNMQRINVGRDTFEVPSERLLSADVAFLPASQNNALRFILNPEGTGADEILVSVQDADVICNLPGAKSPNYRGKACTENRQFSRTSLRRVDVEYSGGTLWEYFNSDGVRVATCSQTGDNTGNCTADGRFENTIFSIHFQDSRIDNLSALMAEVVETLSKWHIRREN